MDRMSASTVGPVNLSGVIFVVLALLWAVFLIPKALRHHDEVARTRSVDRVSDKMRVLARREAVSDRDARLLLGPSAAAVVATATASAIPAPRTASPSAPTPAIPAPRPATAQAGRARLQARRKAAAAAARRRRRILTVLLLADLVVAVLAYAGSLLPWAPAVPVALTLVYLVLCRTLVKREHAGWDAEVRRAIRPPAAVTAPTADTGWDTTEAVPAATPVRVPAAAAVTVLRNEQGVALVTDSEDTASYDAAVLRDAVTTTDAGSLWDPLPVTLPTYVTKPRAHRSVRTIDLREPGVSNAGHDAADSALVAEQMPVEDEAAEPRRAVGS